jgi:4-aminobutyrate aminotransferase
MNHFLRTEGDINLSNGRLEWNKLHNTETSKFLFMDEEVFIHQSLSTPCLDVLEGSEGPYIITIDGKRILDFHGNNLHQVGYGNKVVKEAIISEMDVLPFSPRRFTNKSAIKLANKLTELTNNKLSKVLFAPGGSEVNSMAIKLARLISGKHKVISMYGSFHGANMDTIAVGGEQVFRSGLEFLMGGTILIPQPSQFSVLFNDDAEYTQYFKYLRFLFEHEPEVCAFMAETIRNTEVNVLPFSFWKKIRSLCDEFNVLLILDEIPTWMGRTGTFYVFEHYGIIPDMVTIGKALGGGIFPLAALITKSEYNYVTENSIGHFTHEKSSVGCAAGFAAIQFIEQENILNKVSFLESVCKIKLNELKQRFDIISDVRGIGLLWGIELASSEKTKDEITTLAEQIMYYCLNHGLSFKVSSGTIITLCPSLIITEEQLNNAFEILNMAFETIIK